MEADKKDMEQQAITSESVVEFLKENPDFLKENPHACDFLVPPDELGGGNIADFKSFMIKRLKSDKESVIETTREIVDNVRSNASNLQLVHNAVLKLLEARSFDELVYTITHDLFVILNTDISAIVMEAGGDMIPNVQSSGLRFVPEGTIDKWMGGKRVLLQDNISGIEAIYGGGANLVASQALLRIDESGEDMTGGSEAGFPPAVLAFGSRDPAMFNESQGTDLVSFLAKVTGCCFRWHGL